MFILDLSSMNNTRATSMAASVSTDTSIAQPAEDGGVDRTNLGNLQGELESTESEIEQTEQEQQVAQMRQQPTSSNTDGTNQTSGQNESLAIQSRLSSLQNRAADLREQIEAEQNRLAQQQAENTRSRAEERARLARETAARDAARRQAQAIETAQTQPHTTDNEAEAARNAALLAQQNMAIQTARATQDQPTDQSTAPGNGNAVTNPQQDQVVSTQEQDAATARRMNSGDTTNT
ncbi:MAG: hypothetical protein HY094_10210 [Candidatus Melainabacteria bacterium]|nr:hypothetical protein [Candidatus Melainabacteria bacterium]